MLFESFQKDVLKNISTWFEILEEISKNTTDTSGLPKLEVSLRSGRMFSGSVIGLKKSVDENLVMLLEYPELHSRARIHLIKCEDICTLSFIDPDIFLSISSKEKPVITEFELKRRVKAVEERIEQILSSHIPISINQVSESDRSRVADLTEELPAIFSKLIKDDTGKNLIQKSIVSIDIQLGKTAETNLNNKHLICIFAQDSELFLSKQKEILFHSIEKVL